MERSAFIVTVDTEGDNLWSHPQEIATSNAACLERFQNLCESFGVRPTYVTNYEMAIDPTFKAFGIDIIKRNVGEIGMHLHAWNSPPIKPLTDNDFHWQPYLTDYPVEVMRTKVQYMTRLLEDTFQVKMLSHRAGRWAVNQSYLDILMEEGYTVDSSITPYLYWRRSLGNMKSKVSLDYRREDVRPRVVKHSSGGSGLGIVEVPFTVPKPNWIRQSLATFKTKMPGLLDAVINKATGMEYGLRIANLDAKKPLRVLEYAEMNRLPCAVMMLHSSELMAGGSPYFQTQDDINKQADIMKLLFERALSRFRFLTLQEFGAQFSAQQ